MRKFQTLLFCIFLTAVAVHTHTSSAAIGGDSDKPVPEFSNRNNSIVATLIPRGKSTKVEISFTPMPGELANVKSMDVPDAAQSDVDSKDFRSGLFSAEADGLVPGTEVRFFIRSQYFTGATRFWTYNEKQPQSWADSTAEILSMPDRVYEIIVPVQDGGPLDSDGIVNGSVLLVGGPRDSFWGYALGTLFIRFFGIFLVLCILMLGMLSSSRIFQYIESRKKKTIPDAPMAAESPPPISQEIVAAVGLAIHLHLQSVSGRFTLDLVTDDAAWTAHGRAMTMSGRLAAFVDRTCIFPKEN